MDNVRDTNILELAKRIDYNEDPFENVPQGTAPSKVTVKMKNGSIAEEEVGYAKGTVQNPMTKVELVEKFKELTLPVLSNTCVENIIQTITNLEEVDNITELSSLLSVPSGN